MKINALIGQLRQAGIMLQLVEGSLKVQAPKGQIDAQLLSELKARKGDVIDYLQTSQRSQSFASIPRVESRENYLPSHAQRGLWVQDQLAEKSTAYNMTTAFTMKGELNIPALERALSALCERHETLRTAIVTLGGEPVQVIADQCEATLLLTDISLEPNKLERSKKMAHEDAITPFELGKAPLWRVQLLQLGPEEHVLLFNMHHIISDGWSLNILTKELLFFYDGFAKGQEVSLPILPIQYKDYSEWQYQLLQSDQGKTLRNYWLDALSGELPVLNLPNDRPRPAVKTNQGATATHRIGAALSRQLRALSLQHGTSLFMTLTAVVKTLLFRYSGQNELIVGTPVAGRQHADMESLIGIFVNTLALRSSIDPQSGFDTFLKQVGKTVTAAFEHQLYPFDSIVDELNTERDLSRNPLFDVVVMMPNNEQSTLEFEHLELATLESNHHTSRFDLHFNLIEKGEELDLHLIYNTDLFDAGRMERLQLHFEQLCKSIVESPATPIAQLELLSDQEKQLLVSEFNTTETDYPNDELLVTQFEQQAAKTPTNAAIAFGDTQLTYAQLNTKANRLAHYLLEQEIGAGDKVGLYLQRGPELMISLLGILKSGAAYVPLDPNQQGKRLEYMLSDADIELVLVQSQLVENLTLSSIDILVLDEAVLADNWLQEYEDNNPEPNNTPNDTAYLIYTSGSTGVPKGVEIPHSGLSDYLAFASQHYYSAALDGSLVGTSHCFDITLPALYLPLLNGGCVNLLPGDTVLQSLANSLSNPHAGNYLLRLTPMHLQGILELIPLKDSQPQQHVFVIGGAQFNADLYAKVQEKFPQASIYNHYGPTETVVGCAIYNITQNYRPGLYGPNVLPIGKPMDNTRLYVLDSSMQPVPVGVNGELHVAGPCVSKGYLNQPDLTASRFVADPFSSDPTARLYKTGDQVRWLADGNLEFIGRVDDQVKIRGYRIEPGEIELQLLQHEQVQKAAVVAIDAANGEKELLAALVSDQPNLSTAELSSKLLQTLPEYMVPGQFVILDQLPLTASGKVDKKQLLSLTEGKVLDSGMEYVAPKTDKEQLLAAIWQKVLNKNLIGIQDNFFFVGGDSIKAIQISSRAHEAGYQLSLKDIFEHTSIKDQALKMQASRRISEQGPITGSTPLTPIQKAFFSRGLSKPHHYNQAVLLHLPSDLTEQDVLALFDQLQRHHDALRMVYQQEEHQTTQHNQGTEHPIDFHSFDYSTLSQEAANKALKEQSERTQSSIDLATGPLMKLVLFNLKEERQLLVVIHHLVIDLVSWRILAEDLSTLYQQFQQGENYSLPAKTDSYQYWANKLVNYAQNDLQLPKEASYWKQLTLSAVDPLPIDNETGSKLQKHSATVAIQLSKAHAQLLLNKVNQAYNTELNDVLLTALGAGLCRQFGIQKTGITLEGHGRETLADDLDISRTVGWFTSVYPIVLEQQKTLPGMLVHTKEMLRKIPNKGIGYNLLKQLNPNPEESTHYDFQPQIIFNFSGQFDNTISTEGPFSLAGEAHNTISNEAIRAHELDVSGHLAADELVLTVRFSKERFKQETMEQLMGHCQHFLEELIDHCAQVTTPVFTPSDFSYPNLNFQQLELVQQQFPDNIEDLYPLSLSQEGMLFHALYEEGNGAYFEQKSFGLKGNLDAQLVQSSFNVILKRHDNLRAAFVQEELPQPVQVILKNREIEFQFRDLHSEGMDEALQAALIQDFKAADKARGFELHKDCLMRVALFQRSANYFEITWSHHHIILDGWSSSKVVEEWLSVYHQLNTGETPVLPNSNPFKEYVKWMQQQNHEKGLAFWTQSLEGYNTALALPGAQSLADTAPYDNRRHQLVLDASLSKQLQQVAGANQVSLSTLMQTLWGILLCNYNRVNDAVFGLVVSGRPPEVKDSEEMVGIFINTIPCRIRFEAGQSFGEILQAVQEQFIASAPYHYSPLSEIQHGTDLGKDLINHIMVFQNYPVEEELLSAITETDKAQDGLPFSFTGHSEIWEQTNYDFNFIINPGKQLTINLSYNAARYPQESIERIASHLEFAAAQLVSEANLPIESLRIAAPQEEFLVVKTFNSTTVPYPENESVLSLFETQVRQSPEQMALIYPDEQLTYQALNDRVNQLAHHLVHQSGLQSGEVVGCMTGRNSWSVIALLGILKAGGTYLSIDPDLPAQRIAYVLQNSQCRLVLTHDQESTLPNGTAAIELAALPTEPVEESVASTLPEAAYLIYTSGSTGTPKGVLGTHACLYNLINWQKDTLQPPQGLRSLQYAALGFDVSVQEMLFSVCTGGTLYGIPSEIKSDPGLLGSVIAGHQIQLLTMPFAALNLLFSTPEIQPQLASLQHLITSGEQLTVTENIRFFLKQHPQVLLHNQYGPSETHVVTSFTLSGNMDPMPTLPPIGKPIANTQVYIVDENLVPLPLGVAGEIAIGGKAVAQGYVQDAGLTQSKFIDDPFSPNQRIYKTGDLGRWLPDGNIEFIGRQDDQVKIRGFRIELGEIEHVLATHEDVRENVVIALKNGQGEQELMACICLNENQETDMATLRSHLRQQLPDYMIPARFAVLDELPLSINGKVDKKALANLKGNTLQSGVAYVAPRSETEKALANIWEELLERTPIGITDNFFEVGGHSLKATRMMARIHQSLGLKLPLKSIFEYPNIEQLAVVLENLQWRKETPSQSDSNREREKISI